MEQCLVSKEMDQLPICRHQRIPFPKTINFVHKPSIHVNSWGTTSLLLFLNPFWFTSEIVYSAPNGSPHFRRYFWIDVLKPAWNWSNFLSNTHLHETMNLQLFFGRYSGRDRSSIRRRRRNNSPSPFVATNNIKTSETRLAVLAHNFNFKRSHDESLRLVEFCWGLPRMRVRVSISSTHLLALASSTLARLQLIMLFPIILLLFMMIERPSKIKTVCWWWWYG